MEQKLTISQAAAHEKNYINKSLLTEKLFIGVLIIGYLLSDMILLKIINVFAGIFLLVNYWKNQKRIKELEEKI